MDIKDMSTAEIEQELRSRKASLSGTVTLVEYQNGHRDLQWNCVNLPDSIKQLDRIDLSVRNDKIDVTFKSWDGYNKAVQEMMQMANAKSKVCK